MSLVLTEKLNTILEYTETPTSNPSCLGHLAGIGADLNNPTRNGRKYPKTLWENVMKSEDFKEMMDTNTCFCEANHPVDRIDTDIREVCAVMTNMEIRESEGIVWTEFDILDTPQGRILKSLVDYGCKIGVSSRGLGDEIQRNGETIIDPDTYSFYGFDMVVQPAVKAARPDKVESFRAKAKVTDVFKREIENATTQSELVGLKRLAESVKLPNLDSIKESIDIKLNNGSFEGKNISESLESDLGKLAEENEGLKSQLESLKKAKNIGAKKIKSLTETYKSEAITARRTLRRLEVQNERLERVNHGMEIQLNESDAQLRKLERMQSREVNSLQCKLEDAELEIQRLKKELRERSHENRSINNQLERLTESYNELQNSYRDSESRIVELENEISNKADEVSALYEENNALSDNLEMANSDKVLTEQKVQTVSNKLTEQGNHLNEVLEKYIDARCMSEGIDKSKLRSQLPANYTMSDIEMVVEKLADQKRRFSKLPISVNSIQLENMSNDLSSEDNQTLNILRGVQL